MSTAHGAISLPVAEKADRKKELEQRFLLLLNDKMRAERLVQAAHDEMMKVQGALEELARNPDAPARPGQ